VNSTMTKILSLSISISKARKAVLCSLILAASLHNGLIAAELSEEVLTRQGLIQTALAREPADLIIQGPTVLNVFTQEWLPNQDIVIRKKRIAWVGDSGTWPGVAKDKIDARGEWAVPGFGESHKHIESSYLTPEYEAALVIPRGNTWTMEGSHELSNAIGPMNVAFWLMAEKAGSPLKIFPSIGSATPPTAYEQGAGYYGHKEMEAFIRQQPREMREAYRTYVPDCCCAVCIAKRKAQEVAS